MPSPSERRALVREYKQTPRPMGVYRVRNRVEGRSLVDSATNLPGILNRHSFQLRAGNHPTRELQADWNRLGAGAFVFEILDELPAQEGATADPSDDLAELAALWRERLAAAGEAFYGPVPPA